MKIFLAAVLISWIIQYLVLEVSKRSKSEFPTTEVLLVTIFAIVITLLYFGTGLWNHKFW